MTKTANLKGSDGTETTDFTDLTAALLEVAEWEVEGATITDNGVVVAVWSNKTETFTTPTGTAVEVWEDIIAEREAEDASERRFWNQDSDHRRFASAMGY